MSGFVYGSIIDADTGVLLTDGSVSTTSSLSLSSSNGSYSGSGEAGSNYDITGHAPGYQDNTVYVDIVDGQSTQKNIPLTKN